jgi:NADPH:quinone reductase-like Zn-dependent oxidoreductase
MMNKVVVTAFDPADPFSKLTLVEAAIPTPGAGQMLVHMRAAPVNPADTFSIMVRV